MFLFLLLGRKDFNKVCLNRFLNNVIYWFYFILMNFFYKIILIVNLSEFLKKKLISFYFDIYININFFGKF